MPATGDRGQAKHKDYVMNEPREFTLRGYLDSVRRQLWLIGLVALICGAAGFGLSAVMKKSYTATSTLQINDPNEQAATVGGTFLSTATPLQLSAIYEPQVTRPEVVSRVLQRFGGTTSVTSGLAVTIDPNSYALQISASSRSAQQAAAIANAFASTDASLTNKETRAKYRAQANALEPQLKGVSRTSPQGLTIAENLTRLESLASVAQPLQVSNAAAVPTSPSSPKTTRNTLAALLIGLLLGIALATARDALDRRLRHSRDVARVLEHPVVGHVRAEALGHAGSPAEAANGRGALKDTDQESFRILRQNILYLATAGDTRTVLVTSPMAQEGKSTVAACLAVATAEAGRRTLLIECDLRKPVLAKRLGIAEGPGLTDYLTGNAEPQHILQPVPGIVERLNGSAPALSGGHAPNSNLVCITSGRTVPRPAELLASGRFRAFLDEVKGVYDTVILDTAPLLPVADTLAIVPEVSTMIVCVRLDRTTRGEARAAQAALDRLPQRPVGLVLTDVRQREDGYYYGYYGSTPTPTAA